MSPRGFCPGSRKVKEPIPEYIPCPECGEEVEVWTHELMQPCPRCKTPVFRQTRPSCLDWCPFAKECVGPQIYHRLNPTKMDQIQASGPIHKLAQDHDEVAKRIGLLKASTLCLRAGSRGIASQTISTLQQAIQTLKQVLQFFDDELSGHFRREEEGLFPILERHLGKEKSPAAAMLGEHREIRQKLGELKEKAQGFLAKGDNIPPEEADGLDRVASDVIRLLRSHIDKENTMLLPLATATLGAEELSEVSHHWQELTKV